MTAAAAAEALAMTAEEDAEFNLASSSRFEESADSADSADLVLTFNDRSEHTLKTSKQKGATIVETKLTVDWSGCSVQELRQLAYRKLQIDVQAEWRKLGVGVSIPTRATIKAKDYVPGQRKSVEKTTLKAELVKKDTQIAEMQAQIAQLLALMQAKGEAK